jgi:hypothetical protein
MRGQESLSYWKKYSDYFHAKHAEQIDPEIREYLCMVSGFLLKELDNLGSSATINKSDFNLIKGLLPFLMDSTKVLVNISDQMSLIAASNQARHLLECFLIFKFIFSSGDIEKYADRYAHFAVVNQIKAFQKGLASNFKEEDLKPFRAKYPFWFNGDGTVKGRSAHWTGDQGITTIKELADKVGLISTFNDFYHIGSGVAHGSPEIWRLFKKGEAIDPIPAAKFVYQFSLCSCAFLLETIKLVSDHFSTGYTQAEFEFLTNEHKRLLAKLQF